LTLNCKNGHYLFLSNLIWFIIHSFLISVVRWGTWNCLLRYGNILQREDTFRSIFAEPNIPKVSWWKQEDKVKKSTSVDQHNRNMFLKTSSFLCRSLMKCYSILKK
jgi:hypothetical protein